jgi:hypothetical protein
MSTKDVLLEVAEKLPPDATLVDAIYELEFRQAVEDGLASLNRGERIPLDEARRRIPQWTSKLGDGGEAEDGSQRSERYAGLRHGEGKL